MFTATHGCGDSGTGIDTGAVGCGGLGSPTLQFSTYLGGSSGWEHTRDLKVDGAGNIYIVGGTASDDFPTTAGVYDRTYNTGGTKIGGHGQCDAFVAKFTPDGQLDWTTYLGGDNYDRLYSLEVHTDGSLYVSGRAGPGFPVTSGAFQTDYKGTDTGFYGVQNGVIVKLAGDGSGIIWSSYVGTGWLVRDFDIDRNGDVYLKFGTNDKSGTQTPPAWFASAFANAYQKTPADARDTGVMKVSADGSKVLWATWFGGDGKDSEEGSLEIDEAGRPYLLFNTDSTDLPTTEGVPGTTRSGPNDVFLARFSADGSALELGTYLGGSGNEALETHGVGVTSDAVVAVFGTTSSDLQTTPGAFQTTFGGGWDGAVVKLALDGTLIAATFVGGTGNDGTDGLSITPDGDILYVGQSSSTDFPVTADAHQSALSTGPDGVVVRLTPDLSDLVYSTYLGGQSYDALRAATFDGCDLLVAGASSGPGWPTLNAYQASFAGGGGNWGNGDNILAKLTLP